MKLTTATDPTLVFQKAFWRRPASEDRIRPAGHRAVMQMRIGKAGKS
jgi:hypothetical protein